MSARVFVDADILIYAHDRDAGAKRERAVDALRRLWDDGSGALSAQVLQEFYVNATRKLATPVAGTVAAEVIQAYEPWIRQPTTAATVLRAIQLGHMAQLSFWDALIVASAEQSGAARVFSEALNTGQTIAGVNIVNPLIGT